MNQKTTVQFYPTVEDRKLKFAVLVAIYHGKFWNALSCRCF